MKKNRTHPQKGDWGYYRYEKKKRLVINIFLYAICLIIYFTGLIRTGTNKNMFTLIAILGVLPSAKWTTSLIMMLLQKSPSQEIHEVTEKAAGDLVHGYELCVTAYEGRLSLAAVVVCGNSVAAYSEDKPGRDEFMETHIRKILHENNLGNPKVKIFRKLDHYKERITQLAAAPDKYREGLKYTPDEAHAGETRDEAVLRIIKNISL